MLLFSLRGVLIGGKYLLGIFDAFDLSFQRFDFFFFSHWLLLQLRLSIFSEAGYVYGIYACQRLPPVRRCVKSFHFVLLFLHLWSC